LFIFGSFEQETRDVPASSLIAFRDGGPARATANVTNIAASTLDDLKKFISDKFNGYNVGGYENYNRTAENTKFNIRLDYNLNDHHKLNLKWNSLRSFSDIAPSNSGAAANGRGYNINFMPFQGIQYRINNNLDSYFLELNSTFGGKVANQLTAGLVQMRDFRESPINNTPFPTVDIASVTSFGYEPFSANNLLNSDIIQVSDNLTAYLGKHVVTVGAALELNSFKNGFAPNYYGLYWFNNVDDFKRSVETGAATATRYQQQWSNFKDFPFAEMKGNMASFYVQDEFNLAKSFKLTVGVRGDGIWFPIDNSAGIYTNPYLSSLTGFINSDRSNVTLASDKYPDLTILWSPRVGFNWDVFDDKTLQIRGGVGLFTGRVPYVWLSNQLSNNGVLFGSETLTTATDLARRPFNANPDAYRPATVTDVKQLRPTSYNLAVTDANLKMPQTFRANFAVDKVVGEGWTASVEGIYTKDINAIYHVNVNMPTPRTLPTGVNWNGDTRPMYWVIRNTGTTTPNYVAAGYNRIYGGNPTLGGTIATSATSVTNPNISDAILMKNTSAGYSLALTFQLRKDFAGGGQIGMFYTYTDAQSVNDGGSVAQSIWRDRFISGDVNAEAVSPANFLQRHRLGAYGFKRFAYLDGKMATTIGFNYAVGPEYRFSYVYVNDMNGDGQVNDLMYVPRDANEILLRNITRTNGTVYTAAQQWTDLNDYINQDAYLSGRRGQFAERNGGEAPWSAQFDISIRQDFNIKIGKKINTLQVSFDMFNFGNYISSGWGLQRSTLRSNLLTFQGIDAATGRPAFTFPERSLNTRLDRTFIESTGIGSRWQGQVGVRYIFN
jgi:hypothetical protein